MQLAAGEVLDVSKETEATRNSTAWMTLWRSLWIAMPDGAPPGQKGVPLRAGAH